MKSKLLVPIVSIVLSMGVYAQETWFDEDFNTTEWLDAFTEVLSADGTIRDIRTSQEIAFDLGSDFEIKNFVFNGPIRRQEPAFVSVCGRTFQYCFRMRHNKITYVEFLEVENAGKIHVYVRNENVGTDSHLNLQMQDEHDSWDNTLVTWSVPGNLFYQNGASDMVLTFDINIETPVKLRLYRLEERFLQIYRIVVEKYEPSSVRSTFKDEVKLSITDKTLVLSESLAGAEMSIYNFIGKQVLTRTVVSNEMSLQQLETGIYIVKLKSPEGELVQKIVIK
jgi:hypothetical protein